MRIDYSILWFEDVDAWYDSIYTFVEEILEEHGFKLKVAKYKDDSELDKILTDAEDFDLILMDFNLKDTKGDQIIEKIRHHQLYTEIIFYSASGEQAVRQALIERGALDGVYCANRANEEFVEKVKKVIMTTIKKVQDLNNIRGLVMAETSNLDNLFREIILSFFEKEKDLDKKNKLAAYIYNITKKSLSDNLKKITGFCDKSETINLVNHPAFDSSKKLRSICKLVEILEITGFDKLYDVYNDEIISKRNLFAHVTENIIEGKKILQSHIPGKDPIEFTPNLCTNTRNNLQKHRIDIESLKSVVDALGV